MFPLWIKHDRENDIFEPVDCTTLDITPGLQAAIDELATTWDSQYDLQDPRDVMGKELAMDKYLSMLYHVFNGLVAELRGRYEVLLGEDRSRFTP